MRATAKSLGVSGQYLSMIERGFAPLKMEDYLKICKALQVAPIALLISEKEKEERASIIEKIYALPEKEFTILMNIMQLLQ